MWRIMKRVWKVLKFIDEALGKAKTRKMGEDDVQFVF